MQIKYEIKDCLLKSSADNSMLLKFDARRISAYENRGGFAGSGIASGDHSMSIATSSAFDFQPYNHTVIVAGQTFIITAKRTLHHKTLGESFHSKENFETVLILA